MTTGSSTARRSILVLGAGLLLLAFIGWLDYITGLEVSVVVLYLVPVILASWFGTARTGYLVAVAGALVWHVAAVLGHVSYSSPFVLYWNTVGQLLLLASAAALTNAVRWGRQALQSKVRERTASLTREVAERARAEDRLRTTLADLERRTEQLRALAVELTLAEQRERERLARLLHDDLQQMLVAAKMRLHAAATGNAAAEWRRELTDVQGLLDESVKVCRSLAVQLSPPVLHEVGLTAALRQLGQYMQEAYGLAIEVTADAEIPCDAEGVCILLYQTVRELLLNVVKHAGVKSAQVRVRSLGSGQAEIRVADEGLGFAPEKPGDHIGFGLSNTRGRFELIGGSLEVQSSPGQGTYITLVAPLGRFEQMAGAPRQFATKAAEGSGGGSAGKIRVLIAEDYEKLRLMLVERLEHEADMEVVAQAGDGEEALRLAHSVHPDVVVMDVRMPGMGGVQATRRLTAELPSISVIGLSAYGDTDQTAAIRAAGAVTCLLKESSSEGLVGTIRACAAKPPV